MRWIRWFEDLGIDDVPSVGGKNASLGEMRRELKSLGVQVPDGFALTADAYRHFLADNHLDKVITDHLADLDRQNIDTYAKVSQDIRAAMLKATLPKDLESEIEQVYQELCKRVGHADCSVAVRSSATAEDLPSASFAGQQESYLHIRGAKQLLHHIQLCMASLFTGRAMGYREDQGFDHMSVALSVGVQQMVRADHAASGVMFTLDTESGCRDVVLINSIWGLGENLVQGRVGPDEFYVHKPTLAQGYSPVLWRKLGTKELRMAFDESEHRLVNRPVPEPQRNQFTLSDENVLQLARWAVVIEEHYSKKRGAPTPMDIEWAQDGPAGALYIVQARPETVHSQKSAKMSIYTLKTKGKVLLTGLAVGSSVGAGKVRIIRETKEMSRFQPGDILVTSITDPDWEPIMKSASGIVTERGGRTSHAAIVSRELGIPAVVGAVNAMGLLKEDQEVTLSCIEGDTGMVYEGLLPYSVESVDPATVPHPKTQIMLNLGNPDEAFAKSMLPCAGIGLARMEFIFASWVRVHPLALTRFDQLNFQDQAEVQKLTRNYPHKPDYFVDKLAQGIGVLAGAFYPRPVILRFSDFKTNEYRHLLGGFQFEPHEENPMIGWRGASRYYHPNYKEGFVLECAAVRKVREVFGLKNLKVMIPFCRTPEEGRQVLATMAEAGLPRGKDGLEVYVMAELPSNVFQAEEFASIFDGFSIGSNDLTQLILGVDRDSELVAPLFSERNAGVKEACARIIRVGHEKGIKVGICGQAPSDYLDFAVFLVEQGIDSISLTSDAILRTLRKIYELEVRQLAGVK